LFQLIPWRQRPRQGDGYWTPPCSFSWDWAPASCGTATNPRSGVPAACSTGSDYSIYTSHADDRSRRSDLGRVL